MYYTSKAIGAKAHNIIYINRENWGRFSEKKEKKKKKELRNVKKKFQKFLTLLHQPTGFKKEKEKRKPNTGENIKIIQAVQNLIIEKKRKSWEKKKKKFGEAFTEYLHGEQDRFLEKCGHVDYNTLKKVINTCRSCNALRHSCTSDSGCQCQSCPCKFFF